MKSFAWAVYNLVTYLSACKNPSRLFAGNGSGPRVDGLKNSRKAWQRSTDRRSISTVTPLGLLGVFTVVNEAIGYFLPRLGTSSAVDHAESSIHFGRDS